MRNDPSCLVSIGNLDKLFDVLAAPVGCTITNRSEEQFGEDVKTLPRSKLSKNGGNLMILSYSNNKN